MLGADVFRRVGDIAAALGRPTDDVKQQRIRQQSLTDAINARLTRSDGTYVDGLSVGHHHIPQAGQDTNACAMAYGIVPPEHQPAVGQYIAGFGMGSPPRTATEVLDSLALAGRFGEMVGILDDQTHDGWARILALGGTFTWEVWEPDDFVGDSMSHGWGSNVLVSIQRTLLGVTPTGPGYSTFSVAPPPPNSGLTFATGTVPTPQGPITVAWRRAGASFTIDLTVPPNTRATVAVPGHVAVTFGAGTYRL